MPSVYPSNDLRSLIFLFFSFLLFSCLRLRLRLLPRSRSYFLVENCLSSEFPFSCFVHSVWGLPSLSNFHQPKGMQALFSYIHVLLTTSGLITWSLESNTDQPTTNRTANRARAGSALFDVRMYCSEHSGAHNGRAYKVKQRNTNLNYCRYCMHKQCPWLSQMRWMYFVFICLLVLSTWSPAVSVRKSFVFI